MKNMKKTNVMRILDQNKISYTSHDYTDTGVISGIDVAAVLKQNPDQVFKTLVTVGSSKTNYVFLVPVQKEPKTDDGFLFEYTKKTIGTKTLSNICIIPGNNRQTRQKKNTYNRYYKEQICTRKEERTYGI